MKKLVSIVMVLALVLSMGISAFAAEETGSITITNATIDQTYTAYKIFDASIKLAADGEVNKCDLTVGDITRNSHPSLPLDITAANFGNVSDDATAADFAAATINMVLQTIGTTAVMACRACGCETVVLTGFMSTLPQAEECFALFTRLHGIKFVIPKDATFATSIGAALSSF